MFMLLLALLDILAAAAMTTYSFGHPCPHLQASAALLLVIKAVVFLKSGLSIIDLLCGLTMILLLWIQIPLLPIIIAVYLGLKGLYSLA
jgi:hypothetical protein